MELIESKIGTKVYDSTMNKMIEVNQKNAKLLLSLGHKEFFRDASNNKGNTKPTVYKRKRTKRVDKS